MSGFNCRFRVVQNDHKRIRTQEAVGSANNLPEVGKPFYMYGKSLDPNASFRMINTSEVVELDQSGDVYRLKTKSGSTYEVQVFQK